MTSVDISTSAGAEQRDSLADDALGPELFHAAQTGGRAQVDARAQFQVRDLGVLLQEAQDLAIDAVQAGNRWH